MDHSRACLPDSSSGHGACQASAMNMRTLLVASSFAIAASVFGQDKRPLPEQVLDAEKKCTERIRSTAPESDAVAKQAMNTCRAEREAAEAIDLNNGNQEAQLKFVRKYNEAEESEVK